MTMRSSARTDGAMAGWAAPTPQAITTSIPPGRPAWAASTSARNSAAWTSAQGAITRARPKRSTRRPWVGPTTALASASPPVARPASA
jgi:hypothetical protein